MPPTITKPLMARIGKRFLINQDNDTPFLFFNPNLVPTTDADELVRSPKVGNTTGSATDRTDDYTVPSGKIWHLKNVSGIRANAQVIGIAIVPRGTASGIFLNYSAATATVLTWTGDIRLVQGDIVRIVFATGTSGSLESGIFYEEEEGTL